MTAQPGSPASSAERQARYRARHVLRTVEVSATTHTALTALRTRLGQGADHVIARALASLAAELDRDVGPASSAAPNPDTRSRPARKRRESQTAPPLHPSLPF